MPKSKKTKKQKKLKVIKSAWSPTKKERQKWWADLSDSEKAAYIERVQARKGEKQRSRSIKLMKVRGITHDCNLCIHSKAKACTDNLPRGCEHYYAVKSA